MDRALPFNRKERFFTGTVFPMIVCRDEFRHFSILPSLLGSFPLPELRTRPDEVNFQFFTEYGLLESLLETGLVRFAGDLPARDTPDIIILVEGDQQYLIALEGKMYDNPDSAALRLQMKRQRELVIGKIERVLEIPAENVHHALLIPERLRARSDLNDFPVLTWEKLLTAYSQAAGEDYWLSVLRYALQQYDTLVAKPSQYGKNAEARLTGHEIYEGSSSGTLKYTLMGRNEGLLGEPLLEDIRAGAWRQQRYEVNTMATPPNRNWFSIGDFINLVKSVSVTKD